MISSVSGTAAIVLCGGLLRRAEQRRWLGRAGSSVLLAGAFNACQLFLVAWVLVGSEGYFGQIGPLLLWSVASGLLVAWLSLPLGGGRGWGTLATLSGGEGRVDLPRGDTFRSLAALGLMGASLVVADTRALGLMALGAVAWGGRRALGAMVRTWPFLPYLAWFHLRGTPGDLVWGEWVTRQGVGQFLEQALRLWAFTAFGRILALWVPWGRLVGSDAVWARGFAMALSRMPRLFPASLGAARAWWRSGRERGIEGFLEEMGRKLSERAG